MTDMTPEQALERIENGWRAAMWKRPDRWDEEIAVIRAALSRPAVPDGCALVPETMPIGIDDVANLLVMCGDPSSPDEFSDCFLWVGETRDPDGRNSSYGLNVALSEYPEEGSNPFVIFDPPPLAAAPAEESSADAGEPRRFETPQEFVQWLRSVRAYGSDAEDTWGAAAVAAQAVEDMLEQRQLCPNCGSDIVYEDRVDQGKGVKHCDDCGHEFPNPVYVEQEQPEDGPVATVKAERDALRERIGQLEYSNAVNANAKAQAARHAEEADRLRERVKELAEIIGDIKRWDISNLLLNIPLPLRKRMQAVLAAMQEGKS